MSHLAKGIFYTEYYRVSIRIPCAAFQSLSRAGDSFPHRTKCFRNAPVLSSGLLDGGEGEEGVGQGGHGAGLGQVDGQEEAVIVVAGEDEEVVAGPAPAVGLGLMADHEEVHVAQGGHFVESPLAVSAA